MKEIFALSLRLVVGLRFDCDRMRFLCHWRHNRFFSIISCWIIIVLERFLRVGVKTLESIACWMDWVKFSMDVSLECLSLILRLHLAGRLENFLLYLFSIYELVWIRGVRNGKCSRLQTELGCGRKMIHLNYEFVWRRLHKLGRYRGCQICNIGW